MIWSVIYWPPRIQLIARLVGVYYIANLGRIMVNAYLHFLQAKNFPEWTTTCVNYQFSSPIQWMGTPKKHAQDINWQLSWHLTGIFIGQTNENVPLEMLWNVISIFIHMHTEYLSHKNKAIGAIYPIKFIGKHVFSWNCHGMYSGSDIMFEPVIKAL